jgi:hypothetical protein
MGLTAEVLDASGAGGFWGVPKAAVRSSRKNPGLGSNMILSQSCSDFWLCGLGSCFLVIQMPVIIVEMLGGLDEPNTDTRPQPGLSQGGPELS